MKLRLKHRINRKIPRPFRKGQYYYVRQFICGKDVWTSLGTKNRDKAEKLAYAIWYAQQNKDIRAILDVPDVDVEVALELHVESERYKLLSESTRQTRLTYWNSFLSWCKKTKITSLKDLEENVFKSYLEERGETSNKTYNNVRNELRQIFADYCLKNELPNWLDKIPQRSTSRGEKASIDYRAFSDDEIYNIINKLQASKLKHKDEWVLACHIAMFTGLRYKDVALLKWTSVIGNYEHLELVPHKTESKTNKSVIIKINSGLRHVLSRVEKKSIFVLPGLAKAYGHNSTLYFMRFLEGLGIQSSATSKVGFHSFRATVVTKAALSGVDMKEFGGVIGHTTEGQTQHYNKNAINIDLDFLKYGNQ